MLQIYPDLIKHVRIRIVELQDHVLSTYDRAISAYTAELFSRCAAAQSRTLDQEAADCTGGLDVRPPLRRLSGWHCKPLHAFLLCKEETLCNTHTYMIAVWEHLSKSQPGQQWASSSMCSSLREIRGLSMNA